MNWTIKEKRHMPHTVEITRVVRAGGDPLTLESAVQKGHVVTAPTLAVKHGFTNPIVRYVWCVCVCIVVVCVMCISGVSGMYGVCE